MNLFISRSAFGFSRQFGCALVFLGCVFSSNLQASFFARVFTDGDAHKSDALERFLKEILWSTFTSRKSEKYVSSSVWMLIVTSGWTVPEIF